MIFGIVILISALALSAIAAYYSVLGLLAIFAAGGASIIALGGALEWCKIVATVWLHHNWHRADWRFKIGFGFFIAGLMFLTSMGIFGYLSKGHIDQGLTGGDVSAQLSIFDEKIRTQRENIESARRALTQMDAAVDQILSRSTSEEGARRSAQLRRNQKTERAQLQRDIDQAQREIARLNEERAPIAANVRRVEAEVGPIKYIAAMVYGDEAGTEVLERAVRWVIVLIVSVFDPLALTLILAANKQFEWSRKRVVNEPEPVPEPDHEIAEEPVVEPEPEPVPETPSDEIIEYVASIAQSREQELEKEKRVYLERLDRAALEREARERENARLRRELKNKNQQLLEQLEYLKDLELKVESLIEENDSTADADKNETAPPAASNVGFGTAFPPDPAKGNMFIRVETIPTKLFKFSGRKWIEIDKTITDTYSYNEQYIKHIIDRLQNGEYSVDDLTEAEKNRIDEYLSRHPAGK